MDVYQIFLTHMGVWSWREAAGFILLACAAGVLLFSGVKRGRLQKSQAAAWFILVLYLGIVLLSTIFTRTAGARRYELVPFWSWYEMISTGNLGLFEQIRLNCLLLAPVGAILPFALGREFSPKYALGVGILIAAAIEVSQLVLARGLFEWDDMIHNGIGCMAGCVLGNWVWRRLQSFY
jgi:glycopeptide antibiotics resistance protein